MARFIQGDRPEAGAELAMTGWKLARLFLGVAKATARNKRSDPTFRFLRRGAEKIPRPRAGCAYFEHVPFPNGRFPGGLAAGRSFL
jgi:hypothetical protein